MEIPVNMKPYTYASLHNKQMIVETERSEIYQIHSGCFKCHY